MTFDLDGNILAESVSEREPYQSFLQYDLCFLDTDYRSDRIPSLTPPLVHLAVPLLVLYANSKPILQV